MRARLQFWKGRELAVEKVEMFLLLAEAIESPTSPHSEFLY